MTKVMLVKQVKEIHKDLLETYCKWVLHERRNLQFSEQPLDTNVATIEGNVRHLYVELGTHSYTKAKVGKKIGDLNGYYTKAKIFALLNNYIWNILCIVFSQPCY